MIDVSDWWDVGTEGAFQVGWPVVLAIHRQVREGGSWDQSWPEVLLRELGAQKEHRSWADPHGEKGKIYRLLTEDQYAWVRQALFDAQGRLKDPAYQSLAIPFPEFPPEMEAEENEKEGEISSADFEAGEAGLEEGVVRQGRVVVVDAALVEQSAGLEEFLRRLEGVAPYADRVILLGPFAGSWDRIQTVRTEQELGVLLAALEERIPSLSLTYVGLEERVPHLQALLRGHPNVIFSAPHVSGGNLLILLTAGLGLPQDLAGELSTGLEEAAVRAQAA